MSRQIDDLNDHVLFLDPINDSILVSEPRGSMSLPLAAKRLISKSLDTAKPLGAGDDNDIFPLFISLQNLDRNLGNTSCYATMLKYLPHTKNSIYTLFSMSSSECARTLVKD